MPLYFDSFIDTVHWIIYWKIARENQMLFYMYSINYSPFIGQVTVSLPSHPEESTALKQNDCCPTWYWLGYHVTFL